MKHIQVNHKAERKMLQDGELDPVVGRDQEIERVDWAEPEHEVDPDVMAKVKVLFIRNLTVNTTEDDISAAFEEASDGQIERVSKIRKVIHDRKSNSHRGCLIII